MERYIEMGFQPDEAREATDRYGDDLHAGCHWLMVRQTMGNVPKRLKASHQENTYMGSSVRLNGATWTVDNFDRDHALIRIRRDRDDHIPCRWEHISDQRIEWLTIAHESPSSVTPRVSWKRSVGSIEVSTELLANVKVKISLSQMLNIFIRWGRPETQTPEWGKMARHYLVNTRTHSSSKSTPTTWWF